MRPVEQQRILVMGATDGLGRAVAGDLAGRGAAVLLHGRDDARLERTQREIARATGSTSLRTYRADFSRLDEVRGLAGEIQRDHGELHLLVNNAGIGAGGDGTREESADGYELRFAVNYLAPFLLTTLLLPLIRRSEPARIVNVASIGQAPIAFGDVMLEHHYEGMRAYSQSKLALVMFTFDLAERLSADGAEVTVNALHPASLMNTKMVEESFGYTRSTVEDGVKAMLRVAIHPALDGVSGRYFECLQEAEAHVQAYDEVARRRLLRLSAELVGLGRTTAASSR